MEDGAVKVLGGPVIALPPQAGHKQGFEPALMYAVAGGVTIGAAPRLLSLAAVVLPGTFWSAAGVGVMVGAILILASQRSGGSGGQGPNPPNWFDLLVRAVGIALVSGSVAFLVIELIENPPVRFWPSVVLGAAATFYWWRQVFPQAPAAGLGHHIIRWFACVTTAIGTAQLLGWA